MTTRDLTDGQQTLAMPHRNLKLRQGIETGRLDVPGAPKVFVAVTVHGEYIPGTQQLAPDLEDLNRLLFRYNIPHRKDLDRIRYAVERLGLGIGASPGLPKGKVVLMGETMMAILDLKTEAMQASVLPAWVRDAFRPVTRRPVPQTR